MCTTSWENVKYYQSYLNLT